MPPKTGNTGNTVNQSKDIAKEDYVKANESLIQLQSKVKDEIRAMDNVLKEKQDYFQAETSRLDHILTERLEEVSDNTELANHKAKEYQAILSKVMIAENKIKDAETKVKNILTSKEDSIKRIKERYETWKLTQLDQVARLKLKGKIDNIDKAGLKEILDV